MFGVEPTRPATEHGYIRTAHSGPGLFAIERFVEKPDAETAARYLAEGYLWNSGNFMFRAPFPAQGVSPLRARKPAAVAAALEAAGTDPGFVTLSADAFATAAAKSTDYAVMERAARATVMPVSYGWSDAAPGKPSGNCRRTKRPTMLRMVRRSSSTRVAPTSPPRNSSSPCLASRTWSL
jgi:mannose-1-phosphate guanylyltransferase